MKITDDVIRDLLPIYQAGEVSADTRALVEAYLAEHPAMAEEARRAESWTFPSVSPPPARDAERAALRRTKLLLRWRGRTMAAGILFTGLPFSFAFDRSGFHWLFWPEHSGLAIASLLLGLQAWIAFVLLVRRLRVEGF